MGNRKCLIVAGGPAGDLTYVREWIAEHQPVIFCADGGLRHLQTLGIQPDWLIGDMDSAAVPPDCRAQKIILPREKDISDTQACLKKAMQLGLQDFTLVCASGGRLDHFLCNLSVLETAWRYGADCTLLDENNLIRLHAGGKKEFPRLNYRYLSIVPLDARLSNVTLTGLKYSLTNGTLRRDSMISISNEITADSCTIEIGLGRALIIYAEKI